MGAVELGRVVDGVVGLGGPSDLRISVTGAGCLRAEETVWAWICTRRVCLRDW